MRTGVLLLLGLFLVACGGTEGTTPRQGAPTFPGSDDEQLAEQAEVARNLLGQELQVPAEEIEVVRAEHVTWSNGALGCEEEGGMYTQALVEGYRIELQHDGESYAFHGQDGEPPFYCPEPTE